MYEYIEELNKDELKNECIELNKKLDKIVKLTCKGCKGTFYVKRNTLGVITCPHCSDYVEG
jgi:ribosomal protein L37AE/L43A